MGNGVIRSISLSSSSSEPQNAENYKQKFDALVRAASLDEIEIVLRDKNLSKSLYPLHVAALFGNLESLELILSSGFSAYSRNQQNEMPLHISMTNRSEESNLCASLLCFQGPRAVNHQNNQGYTPVHLAVSRNNLDLLRVLLSHSSIKSIIDLTIQDDEGQTALDLAKKLKRQQIIMELEHFISEKKPNMKVSVKSSKNNNQHFKNNEKEAFRSKTTKTTASSSSSKGKYSSPSYSSYSSSSSTTSSSSSSSHSDVSMERILKVWETFFENAMKNQFETMKNLFEDEEEEEEEEKFDDIYFNSTVSKSKNNSTQYKKKSSSSPLKKEMTKKKKKTVEEEYEEYMRQYFDDPSSSSSSPSPSPSSTSTPSLFYSDSRSLKTQQHERKKEEEFEEEEEIEQKLQQQISTEWEDPSSSLLPSAIYEWFQWILLYDESYYTPPDSSDATPTPTPTHLWTEYFSPYYVMNKYTRERQWVYPDFLLSFQEKYQLNLPIYSSLSTSSSSSSSSSPSSLVSILEEKQQQHKEKQPNNNQQIIPPTLPPSLPQSLLEAMLGGWMSYSDPSPINNSSYWIQLSTPPPPIPSSSSSSLSSSSSSSVDSYDSYDCSSSSCCCSFRSEFYLPLGMNTSFPSSSSSSSSFSFSLPNPYELGLYCTDSSTSSSSISSLSPDISGGGGVWYYSDQSLCRAWIYVLPSCTPSPSSSYSTGHKEEEEERKEYGGFNSHPYYFNPLTEMVSWEAPHGWDEMIEGEMKGWMLCVSVSVSSSSSSSVRGKEWKTREEEEDEGKKEEKKKNEQESEIDFWIGEGKEIENNNEEWSYFWYNIHTLESQWVDN